MAENSRMRDRYETLKSHEQNFINTGERMSQMESGLNELHQTLLTINQNLEYLVRKANETGAGSKGGSGERMEGSGTERARQETYTPPHIGNQTNQQGHNLTAYKVKFPEFNGENPQGWIREANRFFQLNANENMKKVLHAGYYMVGVADTWYMDYVEGRADIDWETFCEMLLQRFLSSGGEDVMIEFTKLNQSQDVTSYQEKFDELKSLVRVKNPVRYNCFGELDVSGSTSGQDNVVLKEVEVTEMSSRGVNVSNMDMLNPEVQGMTVTTTETTQSTITRTEEVTKRSSEVVSEKMLTEDAILEDKDASENQAMEFSVVGGIGGAMVVTDEKETNSKEIDVYWGTTLMDNYAERGLVSSAWRVFDRMMNKNIVTWNALLKGLTKSGDLISGNKLFDEMPERDVVSWTCMITGYAKVNQYNYVIRLFREKMVARIDPDEVTIASVLSAWAHLGTLDVEMSVHEFISERWNHASCILKKGSRIKSIDEVEGFELLRWDDQQKIRKYVDDVASYALGNIVVGNLPKYLPFILDKIDNQQEKQYLLLHSLKEVIVRQSVDKAEFDDSSVEKITKLLFNHCESEEDGVRNVVAECLGKTALIEPGKLIHALKERISNLAAFTRATVVIAVKYSVAERQEKIDEFLYSEISAFLMIIKETASGSSVKNFESELEIQSIFSLKELQLATNNFNYDNKLGEGGFGSVYWGQLWEGSQITVKRLKSWSNKAEMEFSVEVEIRVRHKNSLIVHGYCAERQERLIVYEYMTNLSLLSHLHGQHSAESHLDWNRRMNIAIGATEGIVYLHHHATPHMIYIDIKGSNVDICVLELLLKQEDERNWPKCKNMHPEFTLLSTYIWDPGGEISFAKNQRVANCLVDHNLGDKVVFKREALSRFHFLLAFLIYLNTLQLILVILWVKFAKFGWSLDSTMLDHSHPRVLDLVA